MFDSQNNSYNGGGYSDYSDATGNRHFNLLLLIGALIGAAAGFFAGEVILFLLDGLIPLILLSGIYFAQFMFFIFLAVLICEKIDPRLNSRIWTNDHWKDSVKRLPLMSIIAFFVLGCVFQFIYGLSFAKSPVQKADDYIIVIDNSGSMEYNDPFKERFSAVKSFVNELDGSKSVAVMLFSHYTEVVVPLTKVGDGLRESIESELSYLEPDGGTDIQLALEEAAEMSADSGRTTMVIMLSDGESIVNVRRISDIYNKQGIVLNTIDCCGGIWESQLLLNLATSTGGMNYQIPEMNQLAGTFSKILTGTKVSRMLLDYRHGREHDSKFFAFLRVLFIMLIGTAMSPALGYMLYNSALMKKLLIQKIITGLLAGLVLEFLLASFWPAPLTRLIMAGLLGFLFTFFNSIYSKGLTYGKNDGLARHGGGRSGSQW